MKLNHSCLEYAARSRKSLGNPEMIQRFFYVHIMQQCKESWIEPKLFAPVHETINIWLAEHCGELEPECHLWISGNCRKICKFATWMKIKLRRKTATEETVNPFGSISATTWAGRENARPWEKLATALKPSFIGHWHWTKSKSRKARRRPCGQPCNRNKTIVDGEFTFSPSRQFLRHGTRVCQVTFLLPSDFVC